MRASRKVLGELNPKFGQADFTPRVSPFGTAYGPLGRSANSGITATVFGSYGFVGRYLLSELGSCGSRVYAPFRGCELEPRHLKPMFDLGNLGLMPFSPKDEDSVRESLKNSDIVINLIGKHYETKHIVPTRRADGKLSRVNYTFDDVHVNIPHKIATLAKEAGVKSFIHLSALSADLESASRWSQSKAKGELAVRDAFPEAIIVKPAKVFGHEDRFLNSTAYWARKLGYFPVLDDGRTLLQPVCASDIGKALMQIVRNCHELEGKTFQFVGPDEYTYKEVAEFVRDMINMQDRSIATYPAAVWKLIGAGCDQLMHPSITYDEVLQMTEDNVQREDSSLMTFADLGIEPTTMERVAFDYLHRFRVGGHFKVVQGYHTKDILGKHGVGGSH